MLHKINLDRCASFYLSVVNKFQVVVSFQSVFMTSLYTILYYTILYYTILYYTILLCHSATVEHCVSTAVVIVGPSQPDTTQWHLARQLIPNIEWNRTLHWELNYRGGEKERERGVKCMAWFLLIQVCMLIMLLCWFQPSYGEFDISGNVLGLIFNQGMIWWITSAWLICFLSLSLELMGLCFLVVYWCPHVLCWKKKLCERALLDVPMVDNLPNF